MSFSPQFFASIVTILVVIHLMLGACAYLIFLERKIAAWTQDRIGPNRVNFSFGLGAIWQHIPFLRWVMGFRHLGLGQALVDGVKLILKEEYTPPHVDRALFILAPIVVMIPAILSWAVVPWGGYVTWGDTVLNITAAPIPIGVIYILAVGSMGVYGVVVGGYASNNKYSFLGGLRATAQMLSYEIPMGLCVLIVVLIAGTARADELVHLQAGSVWFAAYQPVLAVIFFTCVLAECNRAPFDLAEAEQELVGGYHTEYAAMKWAMFFLGEYMHMITGSAFFCILFLGGWSISPLGLWPDLPLVGGIGLAVVKFAVFAAKITALLFLMMWIRWTLPRFRFDQLMRLAWRSIIPLTLAVLLVTGVLVWQGASPWLYLVANVLLLVVTPFVGKLIPQGPPVNRRVPLEGSRFSPPQPTGGA